MSILELIRRLIRSPKNTIAHLSFKTERNFWHWIARWKSDAAVGLYRIGPFVIKRHKKEK